MLFRIPTLFALGVFTIILCGRANGQPSVPNPDSEKAPGVLKAKSNGEPGTSKPAQQPHAGAAKSELGGRIAPCTVGDLIKWLDIKDSSLELVDEPPGKLREIRCVAVVPASSAKVVVTAEIVYTHELFSATGRWDIKLVRSAKVRRVIIVPLEEKDDFLKK
jgi:hypothetical protein